MPASFGLLLGAAPLHHAGTPVLACRASFLSLLRHEHRRRCAPGSSPARIIRERAEDVKHEARHRIGFVSIDVLRDRNEPHAKGSQLLHALQALYETPAPAVELPDQHSIEPPLTGIIRQPVEFRAASLRSTPAGVNVFACDLPPAPLAVNSLITSLALFGQEKSVSCGMLLRPYSYTSSR